MEEEVKEAEDPAEAAKQMEERLSLEFEDRVIDGKKRDQRVKR